jgi:DNA-binding CsgD family transcriptional regulator
VRALTGRERQIIRYVANGHTNTRIGQLLGVSDKTVNRHLANVYAKLGARDRANAVALSLRHGEIGIGDIQLPNQPKDTAA